MRLMDLMKRLLDWAMGRKEEEREWPNRDRMEKPAYPGRQGWVKVPMHPKELVAFLKLREAQKRVVRQESGSMEEVPALYSVFPHPDISTDNPKMPLAEVRAVAGPDPHVAIRFDHRLDRRNDQFDLRDELTLMTARALAATLLEAVEWLEDRLETNREEKEKEERK